MLSYCVSFQAFHDSEAIAVDTQPAGTSVFVHGQTLVCNPHSAGEAFATLGRLTYISPLRIIQVEVERARIIDAEREARFRG